MGSTPRFRDSDSNTTRHRDWFEQGGCGPTVPRRRNDADAADIVQRRYASGEIHHDEYQRRRVTWSRL